MDFNAGGGASNVTARPVERTITDIGFWSRRPVCVSSFRVRHEVLLLSWVRQLRHWTVVDWKHVTWSDESGLDSDRWQVRKNQIWTSTPRWSVEDRGCIPSDFSNSSRRVARNTLLISGPSVGHLNPQDKNDIEHNLDGLQRIVHKRSAVLRTHVLWIASKTIPDVSPCHVLSSRVESSHFCVLAWVLHDMGRRTSFCSSSLYI